MNFELFSPKISKRRQKKWVKLLKKKIIPFTNFLCFEFENVDGQLLEWHFSPTLRHIDYLFIKNGARFILSYRMFGTQPSLEGLQQVFLIQDPRFLKFNKIQSQICYQNKFDKLQELEKIFNISRDVHIQIRENQVTDCRILTKIPPLEFIIPILYDKILFECVTEFYTRGGRFHETEIGLGDGDCLLALDQFKKILQQASDLVNNYEQIFILDQN